MSNSELFQALKMFQDGVQQAATTSAINDATMAMQEIQTGITDQAQQRQALTGLSNQLAMKLAGVGAPASTIQTAFQAVAPQQFGSVGQMAMEGELTGNKFYQDTASRMIAKDSAAKRSEKLFDHSLDMEKLGFQMQGMMKQQMLKSMGEKQQHAKITGDELEKLNQLDIQRDLGLDLLQRANKNSNLIGPVAGNLPGREMVDGEFAAFKADLGRFFDSYRVAVTGAGASPGEIEILKKNIPSETDTPEAFKAKLQSLMRLANGVKLRRVKNMGLTGRDVTGLLESYKAEQQTRQAETQQLQRLQQFSTKGIGGVGQ